MVGGCPTRRSAVRCFRPNPAVASEGRPQGTIAGLVLDCRPPNWYGRGRVEVGRIFRRPAAISPSLGLYIESPGGKCEIARFFLGVFDPHSYHFTSPEGSQLSANAPAKWYEWDSSYPLDQRTVVRHRKRAQPVQIHVCVRAVVLRNKPANHLRKRLRLQEGPPSLVPPVPPS